MTIHQVEKEPPVFAAVMKLVENLPRKYLLLLVEKILELSAKKRKEEHGV